MGLKSKEQAVANAQEKIESWIAFDDLTHREQRLYGKYLAEQKNNEETVIAEQQTADETTQAVQKELEEKITTTQTTTETKKLNESISLSRQLTTLKGQLQTEKEELCLAKSGQGKEVKEVVKEYFNENFNIVDNRITETLSWDYSNLKKTHIQGLIAKATTLLASARDYKSQLVTGDIDEAKRFFPPNIFDDANFYVPDVKPGDFDKNKTKVDIDNTNNVVCNTTNNVVEHNGTVGEQFAENGALWALNAGLETMWAGVETRSRAYKIGNLVRSATKVFGTLRAGWKFLKSSYDAVFNKGSFGDVAKYGWILAWWYVLWPSIDKLVRWWDTSKQAAELFWITTGKTTIDNKSIQTDKELNMDAKVSAGLFESIPRKDWKEFTNDKWTIDFEKFKWYLLNKEGLEWSRYKLLQEITQSNSTSRVQNFLTDMGINGLYITQKIQNNPKETITKTYEEAKRRWDAIAEKYDRNDAANIKPLLDNIEIDMKKNNDSSYSSFKEKRMDIERELNILYIKHPKAHPITITYNKSSQQLEVGTYNQRSPIDIWTAPWISTPYNNEPRKTTNHNEAIRIGNLINFLTDPQSQITNRSQVDQPFHISTLWDIEFLKANRREATKQLKGWDLKDISVLNDSFFSPRFEELYPSIADNKQEFINWLNNFKKNGKSIWKK